MVRRIAGTSDAGAVVSCFSMRNLHILRYCLTGIKEIPGGNQKAATGVKDFANHP